MQFIDRISAIEARAQRLNLSLARLCREADVEYSTVWRWKSGGVCPLIATFDSVAIALESQLDAAENDMRAALRRRG